MSEPNLLDLLKRRLENNNPDPESRLLHDLEVMPDVYRQSLTARMDLMCRIASEERLNRRLEECTAALAREGREMIREIDRNAQLAAEAKLFSFLNDLARKVQKSTPIAAEARRRAFYQLTAGTALTFVVAWLAVVGAIKVGLVAHPELTEAENRQLAWAKSVERQGNTAAVEWAARSIKTALQFQEAQAAVATAKSGRNIRAELADYKACRAEGLNLWQSPTRGAVCWFEYRIAP